MEIRREKTEDRLNLVFTVQSVIYFFIIDPLTEEDSNSDEKSEYEKSESSGNCKGFSMV